MIKAQIISNWKIEGDNPFGNIFYFNIPVELYIDKYPTNPIPDNVVRFVLSHEPHPHISVKACYHPEYYNYLLTWKEEHLQNIPNSIFFHAFDNWCGDYVAREKEFAVSTVVGEKNEFAGHSMRQALYLRQNEIKIPKKFYLSGTKKWAAIDYTDKLILDTKTKDALWDTQFHIAIENIHFNNWFTEKLIDCFITRTVPIYIGAPNILTYFDAGGMIMCDTVDEIIEKCNVLTPDTYNDKKEGMEYNFNHVDLWTAMPYKTKAKMDLILKEHVKLCD